MEWKEISLGDGIDDHQILEIVSGIYIYIFTESCSINLTIHPNILNTSCMYFSGVPDPDTSNVSTHDSLLFADPKVLQTVRYHPHP